MLDGFDPIDEVGKILGEKSFCWFAKYGQPIRGQIIERFEAHADVALTLVYKNPKGYKLQSYHVEEFCDLPNMEAGTYPAYYNSFLHRVGTFVKITELRGVQPSTDDLEVKSSCNSLTKALRTSMRGYFVCRPKVKLAPI